MAKVKTSDNNSGSSNLRVKDVRRKFCNINLFLYLLEIIERKLIILKIGWYQK